MRKWVELKGSIGGRKSLRIDEKEKYAAIENEIREVKRLQVEHGQMLQKILDRLDRHVDDGTRAGFKKCDGNVEGTQIGLSEGMEESGDKSGKGNEAKLQSNMEKRRTNGEENDNNIELNKSENEVVEKESLCVAGYKFELAETQYDEDVLAELDVIERNTVESQQNEKEGVGKKEDVVMADEVGVSHVGGVIHVEMADATEPQMVNVDTENALKKRTYGE
ncbi:unnamed protein product [Cuscuta campestris]|uniref:Uncharacterized protein n=1 Tax=Cuscuta campestris TaxID=132261 RepID=A0A484N408_9ASTE|nr:unnamed protein product [Cuscuta campestris]